MPTANELQGLYGAGVRAFNQHDYIKLDTEWIWSSEHNGFYGGIVNFTNGNWYWYANNTQKIGQALPVRDGQ